MSNVPDTPEPEQPPIGLPYDNDIIVDPSQTTSDGLASVEEASASSPTTTSDHSSETTSGDEPESTIDQHGPPDEELEEAVIILRRSGVNPNAELTANPSTPLNPKKPWRPGEGLYVLPCTAEEFNQIVSNVKRIDPTGSAQGEAWRDAVAAGREVMPRADVGLDALTRTTSLWRQTVRSGGDGSVELGAGRPKPTDRNGETQLRGAEALHYLQTALGSGQTTRVPLWHSGIWLTFKAPTEAQLLELERRISNEKILLGRATNGLAYSNMSVYHNSFLFNFALSMVIDCSISSYTVEMLKSKILLPDLPLLLWGLLTTIYPNGYRYHRPCINDPSECIHVVEEVLDIARLSWTDNNALNDAQRKHMQRKTSKFTDVELNNYLSHHYYAKDNTVLLKDRDGFKTFAELRVPTLADYEASGFAWVDGIVSSTDQAFGSQLGGDERSRYILDQAKITSLQQYAHWINRITFNGQKYIEDRQTLESTVGELTGDSVVFENLLEGVRKYINAVTISLIAIPAYKCPACQADQGSAEESKHPHLIPLDIGTIFFILLGQRTDLMLDAAIL